MKVRILNKYCNQLKKGMANNRLMRKVKAKHMKFYVERHPDMVPPTTFGVFFSFMLSKL